MKKTLLCLLAGLMVLSIVGCSQDTPVTDEPEITGDLEQIMEQIYNASEIELPKTAITTVNDENIEYFLGTSDVEYVEAIASEPMMSSIAHSIVLVRVHDGADIEDIKTKIKTNVNGRKWICVGVEDDEIIVNNVGNLIMLSMDKNSEIIQQSFLSLSK